MVPIAALSLSSAKKKADGFCPDPPAEAEVMEMEMVEIASTSARRLCYALAEDA
jgi:hypothetical protein